MMRWRPLTWWLLSAMFFVAAFYFWRLGDKWAAERGAKGEVRGTKAEGGSAKGEVRREKEEWQRSVVVTHGAVAGNLNVPPEIATGTNKPARKESPQAHRLSNTTRSLTELSRRDHALLLENALLDTERRG